jgi:hypothetical protein
VLEGNHLCSAMRGTFAVELGQTTVAVVHFRQAGKLAMLANACDKVQTQKRGRGRPVISLDDDSAEERFQLEPVDHVTPETLFKRGWACTVLNQVLGRLRAEFVRTERPALFDELKVFRSADQAQVSYAEIGVRTGLKEATVKVAVHRLHRRYGELLRRSRSNYWFLRHRTRTFPETSPCKEV